MATRDFHSYYISKKLEKKDSQILQLVTTPDDVTVVEMSAVNTELNYHRKKRKNTKLTCLRMIRTKLVNMYTEMEHMRQLHTFVDISSTL